MDDTVVDFLIRAKRATYAGKGGQTQASRPASHDLAYAEGDLQYIDSYLGNERFAGEEALWRNGAPFWAMNYMGRVVAEGFSGDFLKEALLQVQPDAPYRGPSEYTDGVFTYTCAVTGDFNWFNGSERITKDGVTLYECLFHGGAIQ